MTPVRVASVPSAHPYVDRLRTPGVVRLPDVIDDGTGRWWPPRQLTAGWIAAHAADVDVLHVHFGFESRTVDELRAVVDALDRLDVPLVVTVHDLVNPHLPAGGQAGHLERLGVLVGAADAVITLTSGAAGEIRRRWGRDAVVLPHPHLAPLDRIRPRPPRQARPVVGVDLKDLRANVAAERVVPALVEAARRLDVGVRVGLHETAAETGVGRRLAALHRSGSLELVVHPPRADADLWDHLSGLDACVLPYARGTHSGWLEACWDLGTPVVAPDCGYYAEQHLTSTYRAAVPGTGEDELADSLTSAVAEALVLQSSDPLWRRAFRTAERDAVASAHQAVYRSVLLRAAA